MERATKRIEMRESRLSDGSTVHAVDVVRVQYATKDDGSEYPIPVTELSLDAIDERHAEALLEALTFAIAAHTNEIVLS